MTAVSTANTFELPTPEENVGEEQDNEGLVDIKAQDDDWETRRHE